VAKLLVAIAGGDHAGDLAKAKEELTDLNCREYWYVLIAAGKR
jgi:hypothetical protein